MSIYFPKTLSRRQLFPLDHIPELTSNSQFTEMSNLVAVRQQFLEKKSVSVLQLHDFAVYVGFFPFGIEESSLILILGIRSEFPNSK